MKKNRYQGAAVVSLMAAVCGAATLVPHNRPVRAQETATGTTPAKTEAKAKKAAAPRVKGTAYVRILHAIPDGSHVDVYIDKQKVLSDTGFKTLSDYVPVSSGKRAFKFTAAGNSDALVEEAHALVKDKFYTVAAVTTAGQPSLIFQNESTGKAVAGRAQIRVYHLAPGAPDLDLTVPSTRNKKTGYSRIFADITYKKMRSKLIGPGSYTFQVRADGKVLKEAPAEKIEADKRYSIFIVGKPDASGAEALDILVKPAAEK